MKFCHNCGTALTDEAAFCTSCGANLKANPDPGAQYGETAPKEEYQYQAQADHPAQTEYQGIPTGMVTHSGFSKAAKILMIVGIFGNIISSFIFILFPLPLAWCLPMTIKYFKKVDNNEPVSVGFKVCCLIFVSTIAGIMMLCDKEEPIYH